MLAGKVRRVVVGMSGGVDSTVSAILLKKKGFEVVGAFMKNWDGVDETGVCTADRDCEEAERVAGKLGIQFHQVNLVKEYWNEVFEDLLEDYRDGLTPNPDILCNSRVKFDHFYSHAVNKIGCDAIATGHYARNSYGLELEFADPTRPARLLKSVDRTKDQTFFLSQMPQAALRNTMFPVGELPKSVVKQIAAQAGFPEIASKKESMGICFVGKKSAPGKRGFQEFISEYIPDNPGDLVDIDTGLVLGQHSGLHHWTVGQKTKLHRDFHSYFVVSKNTESNEIMVADDSKHPALYCENFFTSSPHWIAGAPDQLRSPSSDRSLEAEFRFQNMSPLTQCVMSFNMSSTYNWECMDQNSLIVSAAEPMRAVTPGQFAAFYQGDECMGSARIVRPGPSLYMLNVRNCRTEILQEVESRKTKGEDVTSVT
eukprot:GFUD01023303.1.p1 GENE.GFUD01023303.1~~GFUD01023303.1.p1  ORF type:complete len:426 (-),score=120.25 GFUD01023303.1:125-1402(-)